MWIQVPAFTSRSSNSDANSMTKQTLLRSNSWSLRGNIFRLQVEVVLRAATSRDRVFVGAIEFSCLVHTLASRLTLVWQLFPPANETSGRDACFEIGFAFIIKRISVCPNMLWITYSIVRVPQNVQLWIYWL